MLLSQLTPIVFNPSGHYTALWLPAGLCVAAILILGKHYWPVCSFGMIIASFSIYSHPIFSVIFALGSTLGTWFAFKFVVREHKRALRFIEMEDFNTLILVAISSSSISALLTAFAFYTSRISPLGYVPHLFLHWWQANFLAILLVTPTILVFKKTPSAWLTKAKGVEAICLIVLTLLQAEMLFFGAFQNLLGNIAHEYWLFLPMTWAAVRFGRQGVLLVIWIITTEAMFSSSLMFYNMTHEQIDAYLENLWFSILVLSGTGFALAINVEKRISNSIKLAESEEKFRSIYTNAPIGMFHSLPEGHFMIVNPALAMMLGFTSPEELIQNIRDIGGQIYNDRATRLQFLDVLTRQPGWHSIETNFRHREGHTIRVSLIARKVDPGNGLPPFIEGFVQDISGRMKMQSELEKQAHLDFLTGLNNRRFFMELAQLELSRAIRYNKPLSVCMIDIDDFKKINDTYGHKVGDIVLSSLGEIARETLREVDIIGRLGGEEFAIFLPETNVEEALDVAERLRIRIADYAIPLESGLPVRFTLSIGLSCLISNFDNVDTLLNRADKALYLAKRSGKNKVVMDSQTEKIA